jgi:hypothetical protein
MSDAAMASPAGLVAIIVAAHRSADRELEREARRLLKEQYGVKLTFCAESRSDCEVTDA